MSRRGDKLREHILEVAKDLFLEMGLERASMDVVASRAETSKRSLYAHFESKEKLFLAVIGRVRGQMFGRLKTPDEYSEKPPEALVLFCGRYLETLLYHRSIQMSRVNIAETARFPEGAAQYFDVLFTQVHSRLSAYLKKTFQLSGRASTDAAHRLLGQVLYPGFQRALFGVDPPVKRFGDDIISPDVDLKPIRKAVAELVEFLPKAS